jgi:hypothetical protein
MIWRIGAQGPAQGAKVRVGALIADQIKHEMIQQHAHAINLIKYWLVIQVRIVC